MTRLGRMDFGLVLTRIAGPPTAGTGTSGIVSRLALEGCPPEPSEVQDSLPARRCKTEGCMESFRNGEAKLRLDVGVLLLGPFVGGGVLPALTVLLGTAWELQNAVLA